MSSIIMQTENKFMNEGIERANVKVKAQDVIVVEGEEYFAVKAYLQEWVLLLSEVSHDPKELPWGDGVTAAHLPGLADVVEKRNMTQVEHLLQQSGGDDAGVKAAALEEMLGPGGTTEKGPDGRQDRKQKRPRMSRKQIRDGYDPRVTHANGA